MWIYQKNLEYPVNIKRPDPKMAQLIMSQYGGPNGELGASLRYLSQRYAMPTKEAKGLLTDIGTEELAHMEIVATILRQLLKGSSKEQIADEYSPIYVNHGLGIFPASSTGEPFTAATIQVTADPITDISEDMGADGTISYAQHYVL